VQLNLTVLQSILISFLTAEQMEISIMPSKFSRWTSIACLICASAAVSADEFAYVLPLFKDLSASPGDELTITPVLSWRDTDADNYPNKLIVKFNVWDAGTNTKATPVGQTDRRELFLPALPCLSPIDWDEDIRIKWMGSSSPSRVHMLIEYAAECQESVTFESFETFKTFIYSADVASTGLSYARAWKDWEVAGSNGVDWDNDGTKEMQLILAKENAAGDQSKFRVIYMNFADGIDEADNVYTIEYFNY
jgi:hypothetical protein